MGGCLTRMLGRPSSATGSSDIIAMSPSGYYDISDAATLFQTGTRASPGTAATADGDPVGLVLDKSGNNNDLAQATSTKRPLLKISGAVRWLLFDGVDDFLTINYADTSTNWNSVHALRTVGAGAGNQVHSHSTGNVCLFAVGGGTPGYGMFANPNSGPTIAVANGTDAVVTEQWLNPGPCKLAKDKDAYVTSPSISMNINTELAMGAKSSGSDATNIRWYGGAHKIGLFTDPQITTLRDYFAGLQGRTI